MSEDWNAGLCDGHKECGSCWLTACVPCWQFGLNADAPAFKRDEKLCCSQGWVCLCTSLCLLYWIPMLLDRRHFREHFGVQGSGCKDCLAVTFCPFCTICQQAVDYRERTGNSTLEHCCSRTWKSFPQCCGDSCELMLACCEVCAEFAN